MANVEFTKTQTYQKVSPSRDMSHSSMWVGFDACRLC